MGKLLIIPLALVGLLVGSLVWSGGGKQRRADVAYIDRMDIITLDPNQMSYLQDFRISYAFREGLYMYEFGTLKPVPADATGVDVSADKRVWTFHLRPEARWTNGDPVRAKDYLFAWRRMLESPGEYTYLFYYIHNAREYEKSFADGGPMTFDQVGVKALDDLTLQVTLDDPVTFFLDLISFVPYYPMNERSMEPFKTTDDKGHVTYRPEFTRPPNVVTNGAFELKRWDFKRRLWLEKSPTYWDKEHVYLDSIECVVAEDRLSQVLTYESGAVDWVGDVSNDIAAELKRQNRSDLRLTPGFGTNYLVFNVGPTIPGTTTKNPFGDVRVRQALAMAIDKQQICDNITRMGERPARTFVPPGAFAGYPSPNGFGFDVARARELLAEAGYPGGKGFPAVPLMYRVENTVWRDEVQNVKSQLRANLGIDIELVGLESKIVRARFNEKNFVIGISQWTGDYGDPSTFTDMYLTTSQNNDTTWSNPEYDGLIDQANRQADIKARYQLLARAEGILVNEAPILPMFHAVNMDWCRGYVTNYFSPRMTTVWKGMRVDEAARGRAR